jgi:hypothetical protein
MLAVGGSLLLLGTRRLVQFARAGRGDAAFRDYASGLRLVFAGLALAGVAAAWITLQGWLLAIALGVGGEELLETSLILRAGAAGRRSVRRTDPQHHRHAARAVRPVGAGWLD